MTDDPLEHSTANCPRCFEPMEPTDDGFECVGCAIDAITGNDEGAPDSSASM